MIVKTGVTGSLSRPKPSPSIRSSHSEMALSNKNLSDETKYLSTDLYFQRFWDHPVCPNGRLGASRPPSPATMACQGSEFNRQSVMNSSIRQSSGPDSPENLSAPKLSEPMALFDLIGFNNLRKCMNGSVKITDYRSKNRNFFIQSATSVVAKSCEKY